MSMPGDWSEPLRALRYHWGEAYAISRPEDGVWLAQRLDTRETLKADTPFGLRQQIIDDYAVRPVPREVAAAED